MPLWIADFVPFAVVPWMHPTASVAAAATPLGTSLSGAGCVEGNTANPRRPLGNREDVGRKVGKLPKHQNQAPRGKTQPMKTWRLNFERCFSSFCFVAVLGWLFSSLFVGQDINDTQSSHLEILSRGKSNNNNM